MTTPKIRSVAKHPTRDTRSRRLYDRRWQKLSEWFVGRYPVCVWCIAGGDINKGAVNNAIARQRSLVVDHITPHRGAEAVFWDEDNWQTLCRYPCHDSVKARLERAGGDQWAWFDLLRKRVAQHRSGELIEAMRDQLPLNIYEELTNAGNSSRGNAADG